MKPPGPVVPPRIVARPVPRGNAPSAVQARMQAGRISPPPAIVQMHGMAARARVQPPAAHRPGPPAQPAARVAGALQPKSQHVVQRMEERPPPPQKNPWRHLDAAIGNQHWPHRGKIKPAVQIELARYIVGMLNGKNIKTRLGGSVAALGYMSEREPGDIDIDIAPKATWFPDQKQELIQAIALTQRYLPCIRFTVDTGAGKVVFSPSQVIHHNGGEYVMKCTVSGPVHSLDMNSQLGELSIDVEFVNETAFTDMHYVLDPGSVPLENIREVAGAARLVADAIDRHISNASDFESISTSVGSSKGDLAKIKLILGSKMRKYDEKKFIGFCAKVLSYFDKKGGKRVEPRYIVKFLCDIAVELDPKINRLMFSVGLVSYKR